MLARNNEGPGFEPANTATTKSPVAALQRRAAVSSRGRRALQLPIAAVGLLVALTACDPGAGSVLAPVGNAAVATVQVPSAAAAASMRANRGSWNNWHVHDLAYGAESFTDANGLRHEDYDLWPLIWPDYAETPSLWAYCPDGIEKALVGGDGGSKLASGTCQNDLYIIPIKLNASDAPAPKGPKGWMALPLGGGLTLYYRLIPR